MTFLVKLLHLWIRNNWWKLNFMAQQALCEWALRLPTILLGAPCSLTPNFQHVCLLGIVKSISSARRWSAYLLLVVILQDANLKTKSDKCNSFLADYIPNLTTAAIYHVDPLLLTSTGCHFKICTSLIIVEFNLVANKNSDEMSYLDGATGNYCRRAVWYCRDVNPALMCSRNVLLFRETFSNKPVLLRRIIGLSMNGLAQSR